MDTLHRSIDTQVGRRVFGYYRFREANKEIADLFIGYNAGASNPGNHPVIANFELPDYQLIHQDRESWDTTAAWNLVDFSKVVHSVLEEYETDGSGSVIATRVYVYYQ